VQTGAHQKLAHGMQAQVTQQPLAGAGETFIGQVDAAGECQRQ
jgi:hypothetical protein